MRVLYLTSEVRPWSKTGGLADVAAALPPALAERGHRVTVISPLYASVSREGLRPLGRRVVVELGGTGLEATRKGGGEAELFEATGQAENSVRWIFVSHPFFERSEIYGEYPDNWRRFAFFSAAALEAARQLELRPEIVHGNDWHTSPALWLTRRSELARGVFTIHNLAYQGLFPAEVLGALGWPSDLMRPEALEFYGQLSFLKAGLVFADRLTTVSPTYAREICTPEQGCGLEGLLSSRSQVLREILNGIDTHVWDPSTDRHLPARYSAADLGGKASCKAALQRELGLPVEPNRPLVVMVSRFSEQKGFDLLLELLGGAWGPTLLAQAQLAILGNGDAHIEKALLDCQRVSPKTLVVRVGFDDGLAHRLEAGGNLFLMPSRYEPCGLNQMYSMRYGTVPVVRATGGLVDTVPDAAQVEGTGFAFGPYTSAALRGALERALTAYARGEFADLQRRGMRRDFSWQRSAAELEEVYQEALRAPSK